jgi:DNA-binding beta-propeller fold protein YncE
MVAGVRRALCGFVAAAVLSGVGASAALANPGDLYVGNAGAGNVIRINHKTAHQSVVAHGGNLNAPDSGAFDRKGRLLIADYRAFTDGAIFRINVSTGAMKTLAHGGPFKGPTDVAVSPGGGIFADDPFAGSGLLGAIFKIAAGSATTVSDGQLFNGGPLGLAFTPGGKLLTTDQDGGPGGAGALIKVKQGNGHQSLVSHGGKLEGGYGMTLNPSGKLAYIADDAGDSIVRVNIKTGHEKIVAQGKPLNGPTDVALGLDNHLYAANDGSNVGAIIRINPKTGHAHAFARGGKLDGPEGITIEPR